jgi:uncharacterized protein
MVNMKDKDLIARIENYVKQAFTGKEGKNTIAHDFTHVDRVRNWALFIAEKEQFNDMETAEIAALLHDIGRVLIDHEAKSSGHGKIGAELAERYLTENSPLNRETIFQISRAIKYHDSRPSVVDELCVAIGKEGKLIQILRDADQLDAIGTVGLMRAFTSKYHLPEYDPDNIKGETWGFPSAKFTERFDNGTGIGKYIIDQVNFQISLYECLRTKTAIKEAKPIVQFMKEFVIQLETEIMRPR